MSYRLCDAGCPMKRRQTRTAPASSEIIDVNDLEKQLATGEPVEYCTIPGFLSRIPHEWMLEDFNRFGDKVTRAADAMQLSWVTTMNKSLGPIRVFAYPFLARVYQIVAAQTPNWPAPEKARAIEEGKSRELRKQEGIRRDLQSVVDQAPPDVQAALGKVVEWLEAEAKKLRAIEQSQPGPQLRPV
jgi:hypothetical protein